MEPWNKAQVTDATFRAVWRFYDGSTWRIAEHLHMGTRTVATRGRALGLRKADYLTTPQAAKMMGISANAVGWWIRRGELPAVRNEGPKAFWKLTRDAVLEFRERLPMLNIRHLIAGEDSVTVHDLAHRLGYAMSAVRHLCADGTIQAEKTTWGAWRIPESEAARIVAEVRENGHVVHHARPRPKVKELIVYPKDFPGLLRFFVERSGRSGNHIAVDADIDPAMLTRAMRGLKGMGRGSIDAVAGALKLTETDHGRLLVAAGFCPRAFLTLGYDESIDAVAETLARLGGMELDGYRQEILTLSRRWRAR